MAGRSRVPGRPRIALRALKLDEEGRETDEALDPLSLQAALKQSRRIVVLATNFIRAWPVLRELRRSRSDAEQPAFQVPSSGLITTREPDRL